MRRCLVAALVAGIVTLFLASPALAQRDPFKEPGGGGTTSEPAPSEPQGNTDTDDPTVVVNPQPDPDTDSDQLATTGAEPAPFLVIAYGLIAAGFGAVFLGRPFVSHRP